MQFDPAGKMIADMLIRRESLSKLESGKIRGICKESDESAFKKALSQSNSHSSPALAANAITSERLKGYTTATFME